MNKSDKINESEKRRVRYRMFTNETEENQGQGEGIISPITLSQNQYQNSRKFDSN